MMHIGLTGGMGSGKSLVCTVLGRMGVPVYYADQRAGFLQDHDPGLRKDIAALLGPEVYDGSRLNRRRVAALVFSNPDLLARLNALVHPLVRSDYLEWREACSGVAYTVEEAAILFESGAADLMDKTVVVTAPEELRVQRVMRRDGLGEEEVRLRMARQMTEQRRIELADELIVNDGQQLLLPRIVKLHEQFMRQ